MSDKINSFCRSEITTSSKYQSYYGDRNDFNYYQNGTLDCYHSTDIGIQQYGFDSKYSTDRVGQKYGTFAERLKELTQKASTTKTIKSDHGDIIKYIDKDGNTIGESFAPKKDTAGYIINGETTFFTDENGQIKTIEDSDKQTIYRDKNGDGKIDLDEASFGFLA